MKDELAEALYKKYPDFFKQDELCFECGDGWYNIIDCLAQSICLAIEGEKELGYSFYVTQVKEKYGTLRFYMSCETDRISDLIRFAEGLSAVTCEVCGSPGRLNKGSWREVRCESHTIHRKLDKSIGEPVNEESA